MEGENNSDIAKDLLRRGDPVLQSLFLTRWKEATGLDWLEDHAYRFIPKFGREVYRNASNLEKAVIQDGKVDQWESPLLFDILLAFGKFDNDGSSKCQEQRAEEDASIRTVKNLWHNVHKNQELSQTKLRKIDLTFRTCMAALGESGFITEEEKTEVAKELPSYVHNPERADLIKRHREFLRLTQNGRTETVRIVTTPQEHKVSISINDEEKLPEFFFGLKPITIKEMQEGGDWLGGVTYLGCVIHLTLIEDPLFLVDVHQVAQDEEGSVIRLRVCKVEHNEQARLALKFGRRVSVIQPRMKKHVDGGTGIWMDEPECLLVRGMGQSTMCRYCGRENTRGRCSNCRVVEYCDRKCQKLDWNILSHKLVCVKYSK